ncbi:pickpocket protein 28-like [Stomoxys calcitrans]|uniref:pickpocket protein 28-like n=1 Tax=Stomoxys calcitrans TaxID=35570 RepID=UPI0027E2EDC0|nr:pickpocket protein 28-like [Stomoxys calcitrans]
MSARNKSFIIDIPSVDKEYAFAHQPKSKKNAFRQSLEEVYSEFCSNTTIHGFQYFGQHRPWKEVIFWIAMFVASIFFCTYIIVQLYGKWCETPVIVSLSEKSTPIWNIPFPAVTICPETKRSINQTVPSYLQLVNSLRVYLQQGKKFHSNFTTTDLKDALTLMQLCDVATDAGLPSFQHDALDYIEILNKMLPDFNRYCYSGIWFGVEKSCDKMFSRTYTEEGVCFTFNGLKEKDLYRENTMQYQRSLNSTLHERVQMFENHSLSWSLEEGYKVQGVLHTYPARVLGSGSMAGFMPTLQGFAEDIDYSCRYVAAGFKILLHSPDDVPTMSKHFLHISMNKDIMIAVKPKMITTSAGIAEYTPHKRQCYLTKDRQLKFFKIYSQTNCAYECLTNFTYHLCGCVTFAMPRSPETPVCGADKLSCYRKANEELLFRQFNRGLQAIEAVEALGDCDCLPACTSLDYETEISEGSFSLENTLKAIGDFQGLRDKYPGMVMSALWIYFKEPQFITSRRSELYGVTDLLANFGGVCGLFMGVSLLSGVEIFYHFTLRLWSNLGRNRRRGV